MIIRRRCFHLSLYYLSRINICHAESVRLRRFMHTILYCRLFATLHPSPLAVHEFMKALLPTSCQLILYCFSQAILWLFYLKSSYILSKNAINPKIGGVGDGFNPSVGRLPAISHRIILWSQKFLTLSIKSFF